MKVVDLKCGHDWDWELIFFDLPECIKNSIRAFSICLLGMGRILSCGSILRMRNSPPNRLINLLTEERS